MAAAGRVVAQDVCEERQRRRAGSIVPASVFGPHSPSNRLNVGAIGVGRIARGHDLPGVWQYDDARIVAVCDLDGKRMDDAKTLVNGYYARKTGKPYDGVTGYGDYRELLKNKDIDAVEAGKDVYRQKPAALTIAEGRALSNAAHRTGRIFQIGSQQRSTPQFRYAAELVRNERAGEPSGFSLYSARSTATRKGVLGCRAKADKEGLMSCIAATERARQRVNAECNILRLIILLAPSRSWSLPQQTPTLSSSL